MDARAEAAQAVRDAETEAKALGLDVVDLHAAAQVHRATWNRWRAGEFSPSLDQWLRVKACIEAARVRAGEAAPAPEAA